MTIDATLNKRLERGLRQREQMRRKGVVHRDGPDGLIRSRPRLIAPQVPMRGMAAIAVLFIAFKALLFAQLGSGNYALKVQEMRAGTTLEQVGAVLMQEDRITVALGGYLKQFVFQR